MSFKDILVHVDSTPGIARSFAACSIPHRPVRRSPQRVACHSRAERAALF